MKRQYTVIVADLVESREIKDRQRAKKRLEKVIRGVRGISESDGWEFKAPPVLTRGLDELSAVLLSPTGSYRICRFMNFRIYPLKFRFSVVTGMLDVGLESGDAAQMDGPAFHRAARGLQMLREAKETYYFQLSHSPEQDEWICRVANLAQTLIDRWSARQHEAAVLAHDGHAQKRIAAKLGISQQAVSERLRSADWDQVSKSFDLIDKYLSLNTENQD